MNAWLPNLMFITRSSTRKPRASGKPWGAAAEVVKAMASKRGVVLESHGGLWEFATKLDGERPELSLLRLFHIADGLRANFYENWMALKAVAKGAGAVSFEKVR